MKIYTNQAPEPIGPYSQAIKLDNGFIFTSGQIGTDIAAGVLASGIKEQTKHAIMHIKNILKSAGLDLSHVVKTTVYLKNMNDFSAMNEIYSEFFGESRPARSTIEVARLPKDALIEIAAIAFASG